MRGNIYKLGDFGLATNTENRRIVDDGDSRYMSPEILNDDYSDLKKADIFSLGCTILELCRSPLPYSGEEWQNIRAGNIGTFDAGRDLHKIILSMLAPAPEQRPGAASLRKMRVLMTDKERELQLEKNRVADLQGRMDALREGGRGDRGGMGELGGVMGRGGGGMAGARGGGNGGGGTGVTRLMRASTWTG